MAIPKLSQMVERYFEAWIGTDTWHTNHPIDQNRFHRFVYAILRYSNNPIAGSELEILLIQKFTGCLKKEYLAERAEYYGNSLNIIYEYSQADFIFPDELIERTNISRYYHECTVRSNNNEFWTELKMRQYWGEDWQNQLAISKPFDR